VLARLIRYGPVRVAFTGRGGGVSSAPYDTLNLGDHVGDDPQAVATNRRRLAKALQMPVCDFAWMHQVHGRQVAVVDGPLPAPPRADALVTTRRGLVLAVLVADCVPLLLADSKRGVVAGVHVGRRGLVAGVVPAAVAALRAQGAADLVGWLGPSVCPACYEVPAELRAEVCRTVPAAYASTRSGTPAVDLAGGVTAQLAHAAVVAHDVGECTREHDEWYSYRRDGRTGRQAGLIWLGD
jgi:YfiH family protein